MSGRFTAWLRVAALLVAAWFPLRHAGETRFDADPGFAIQSLAHSLEPQTASFVRRLGDAFESVPAVREGRLSREAAAELFLRLAYSHYLVPHRDPEVLLADLRDLAGLPGRSITRVAG